MTDKIKQINELCKFEWQLTVNGHRSLNTGIYEYNYPHFEEDTGMIEPQMIKEILNRENCVSICLYPRNCTGFYWVYHYDLESALDATLKILQDEPI